MSTSSDIAGGAGPSGSAPPRPFLRRTRSGRLADRAYVVLTALAAAIAIAGIAYLIYTTAGKTGDLWQSTGVWSFISGDSWVPQNNVFGALPFIYGTLVTSAIAMVIAVPVAIGVALATTVFLPVRLRGPLAGLIDLLAAVPSVVFGLWGVTVLVPASRPALQWIADHSMGIGAFAGPVTGSSYLLSGLVLAVMVLPIISAVTREVLVTVPTEQREAALALGATRWEMVRGAMLPWARSGIVGACALGLGRAVGETIAIAMLLGNSPKVGGSLLGPGSTLAGVIANETGEASQTQLAALTALAIVLFLLAFAINAAARVLVARSAAGPGAFRRALTAAGASRAARPLGDAGSGERHLDLVAPPLGTITPPSRARRIRSRIAESGVYACVALALLPLGFVIGEMLIKGIPALSIDFLTKNPSPDVNHLTGGIGNAIVGTLMMLGIATLIAAPLGVLVALFISDTSGTGAGVRRTARAVGFFVDVLLGVPSIVVGLTVYLGVVIVQGHFSGYAGGLALAVIMFPIIVRASDEVLRLVPHAHREGALALGAPKWRTSWSVVLPAAIPGILTGMMLAVARAAGETAPLLFTSDDNLVMSTDPSGRLASIPREIFKNVIYTQTDTTLKIAWGGALVLVTIILILNLGARLVARRTRVLGTR